MGKKKTLQALRKEALTTLQLMKRLEMADDNGYCTCVSCGVVRQWNDGMHGGHFVPKGKGGTNAWALVEENVWPQCAGCNGFQMAYGKAAQQYTTWMIDWKGREAVDEMLTTNPVVKYTRADLEEKIFAWKEHIKFHKARLGVK